MNEEKNDYEEIWCCSGGIRRIKKGEMPLGFKRTKSAGECNYKNCAKPAAYEFAYAGWNFSCEEHLRDLQIHMLKNWSPG